MEHNNQKNNMRLIIGLTGGIGSGKSTVAKAFSALGVTVVDADTVARQVVEPGQTALHEIALFFGEGILDREGRLNRGKLRNIIFQSPEKKAWLNALLHPIIRDALLEQLSAASSEYVILEAPLLFENDLTQYTEYNLVVDVPETIQIERAMKRDGNTHLQIQAIIDAQMSREKRLEKADYIIDNSSQDQNMLQRRIKILHQEFISLTKRAN